MTNTQTCQIALKEWAVVLQGLLEGSTLLVVRKGGIVEPNRDGFRLLHKTFWLFPTLLHQKEEDLSPALRPAYAPAQAAYAQAQEQVPFGALATVAGAWHLQDENHLEALAPFSPLAHHALVSRFHFGKAPGLWAVALRAFDTAEQHVSPYLSIFGGCTSWVELPEPLGTGVITPVLSQQAFDRRFAALTQALGPPGVV